MHTNTYRDIWICRLGACLHMAPNDCNKEKMYYITFCYHHSCLVKVIYLFIRCGMQFKNRSVHIFRVYHLPVHNFYLCHCSCHAINLVNTQTHVHAQPAQIRLHCTHTRTRNQTTLSICSNSAFSLPLLVFSPSPLSNSHETKQTQ